VTSSLLLDATQEEEPEVVPPAIHAALTTEYIAAYVYKADDISMTEAFLASVRMLEERRQSGTVSMDKLARSVISKAMNSVTKSISLGAVFIAHLLAGHGDAQLSYETQIVNFASYFRHRFPGAPASPGVPAAPSPADAMFDGIQGAKEDSYKHTFHAGHIILCNEVESYMYRSRKLEMFSPMEMAMAFCVKAVAGKKQFEFMVGHPLHESHAHVPRKSIAYPQFVAPFPSEPSGVDGGMEDKKDDYAAFVLTLFRPWRKELLPRVTDASGELQTATSGSWTDFTRWRRGELTTGEKDGTDRRLLDTLASQMLDNCLLQAAARGYHGQMTKVSSVLSGCGCHLH